EGAVRIRCRRQRDLRHRRVRGAAAPHPRAARPRQAHPSGREVVRVRLEFVTRFGGLLRLPFVREPAHTGFLVIEHSGLDSSPRRVHERRSAGQRGATEAGYEWEPRDISLVVKVIGNDKAHWDALVRLLRTAVVFSDAMLDDPQMARLRVVYDDR